MKKKYQSIALFGSALVASVLLSSCGDMGYSSGGLYPSSDYRQGIYSTLPSSFDGDAYYYDGRYYSGGNYETGRYTYNGRNYDNRYRHNGQYIYGGKYQQYNRSSRRANINDSSRYNVYTALPADFSGNAYYHDGRYYSGGNYETGRYDYNGRRYDNRYNHNGNYIYGGRYQQYDASSPRSDRGMWNTQRIISH